MKSQKQAMRGYAIMAAILMAIAFLMREIYEDLPNAMLQSVMCLIRGPHVEFCVSEFRQTQEYHVINVHDGGLFPLSTALPVG